MKRYSFTIALYNPQRPPNEDTNNKTTSGKKVPFAHYAIAKYLLDQDLSLSPNEIERTMKASGRDLLFARDWERNPWGFWIDDSIEEADRGELVWTIKVSVHFLPLLILLTTNRHMGGK